MGAPFSQDLRDRVLAAYDDGMETTPIARLFRVSPAWARRLKQRRREWGQTGPRPMGGVRVIKIDMDRLSQLVHEQPDATIVQLHQRLNANCCVSAVGAALQRLRLSFKKSPRVPLNKTGPMSHSGEGSGSRIKHSCPHRTFSSSTRPGPKPT